MSPNPPYGSNPHAQRIIIPGERLPLRSSKGSEIDPKFPSWSERVFIKRFESALTVRYRRYWQHLGPFISRVFKIGQIPVCTDC